MSRFGTDYQVGRPTGECVVTGETLETGTEYIATLCEHPQDEGFVRQDVSLGAWDRGERPEGLFSYWRTVVPASDERRNLLVDDEVLVDLFERLAADERPQRIAFRFVLALILMRKRKLKFVGRRAEDDGAPERWLFRPRGVDAETPPVEVVNPSLGEEDIRELTDQLTEVLQGDL